MWTLTLSFQIFNQIIKKQARSCHWVRGYGSSINWEAIKQLNESMSRLSPAYCDAWLTKGIDGDNLADT